MKNIPNNRINRLKNSVYTDKINYSEEKKINVTSRFK